MRMRDKLTASLSLSILLENAIAGLAVLGATDSGWKPLMDQGLLEPLTLLLTLITLGMISWLVFYVEVHRNDPLREKILGVIWRGILTAILLGVTIQFWFILQPVPFRY